MNRNIHSFLLFLQNAPIVQRIVQRSSKPQIQVRFLVGVQKFENMNRLKLTIVIDTEKQLTNEEISCIMDDMKYRLMGYSTECPECLKGSDISIIHTENNTLPSFKG